MPRVFFPTADRVQSPEAVAAAAEVEATSAVPEAAAPSGADASAVIGSAPAEAAAEVAASRAHPCNAAVKQVADTAPARVEAHAALAIRCWHPTPRCCAQAVAQAVDNRGSQGCGRQQRRPTRWCGCCRPRGGPGETAPTLKENGLHEHTPRVTAHAWVSTSPQLDTRRSVTNTPLGQSQCHGHPCAKRPSDAAHFRQLPAYQA